jgi:hypothetical protein
MSGAGGRLDSALIIINAGGVFRMDAGYRRWRHSGRMENADPFTVRLVASGWQPPSSSSYRDDMPPQFNALWRGYYEAFRPRLNCAVIMKCNVRSVWRVELCCAGLFYRSNRS